MIQQYSSYCWYVHSSLGRCLCLWSCWHQLAGKKISTKRSQMVVKPWETYIVYTDVCGDDSMFTKLYNGHVTCSNGTVTVDTMFCLTHYYCSNSSSYRVVAGTCSFGARTVTRSYSLNFSSINECKESNAQVFCKNFNCSVANVTKITLLLLIHILLIVWTRVIAQPVTGCCLS